MHHGEMMDLVSTLAGLLQSDAPSSSDLHAYWLLDQSALPPSPWLTSRLGGRKRVNLLSGDFNPKPDDATPWLVEFGADKDRELRLAEQLHSTARFANAVGVMHSAHPLGELASMLRERSRIMLPGNLAVLLRVFDTRTLASLPQVLSAQQYAQFMQGIHGWWYLDRRGSVQRMPAAEQLDTNANGLALMLDDIQEQALVDDGLTDAVIDLLITQQHPIVQDTLPPDQFDCIAPLVQAGRRYGLTEPPQALAFVGKAWTEGNAFDQREPWATLLAQCAAGGLDWQTVLA